MPILKDDVSRRMPDGRIVPPKRFGGAVMPSELGMEAMQRMKAARRSRLLEWRRDARERWWQASRAPFDVGKYLLIEVAREFGWLMSFLHQDDATGVRRIEFTMPGSSAERDEFLARFNVFAWPDQDDWGWNEGDWYEWDSEKGQPWRPFAVFQFGPDESDEFIVGLTDDLLRDEHALERALAAAMADTYCAYVESRHFPCEAELPAYGVDEE